jgi:hypothetical protein
MCQDKFRISKHQLVEIPIASATDVEFSFPQNLSTIEKGRIKAIAAFSFTQLPVTPTNKPTVNATVFKKSFLTLRKRASGKDDLQAVPLQDLVRSANNGEWFMLDVAQYDFSQSKIVVPDTTGLVAGESFLLQVIYEDDKKC